MVGGGNETQTNILIRENATVARGGMHKQWKIEYTYSANIHKNAKAKVVWTKMTVRRRKTMPVQKPLPTTLQYPELTSPVYKN